MRRSKLGARDLVARLLAGSVALGHGAANPAGFAVDFVGARSVGTATAGSAAAADASTIFFNPAGIALLKRPEWVVGSNLFVLHDRFSDDGSTILGGALPTPGGNGTDGIPTALIPWIFGSYPINDELAAGIGIFSPFGLKTDYGPHFVGRYQNLVTSLKVIDVNPVLAYRPHPAISVGAGMNVQYARLRLTQSIDFGSACAVAIGTGACEAGFGLVPGQTDSGTQFKADNVAVGYSVGMLVTPIEGSRFGVNYRSRVKHDFDSASQTFNVTPGARAFLAAGGMPVAFTDGGARASLPLPARLSFGWHQKIGNALGLMADATLTMWHVFRTTKIEPDDPATGAGAAIEQRYKDAWRFAVGTDYQLTDTWAVRAGIAYDQTPVRRKFIQAALPDQDRMYFSAGASYGTKNNWTFDIGYSYVRYVGNMPINRAGPSGDVLKGKFDAGGHVVAAQLKYQFGSAARTNSK